MALAKILSKEKGKLSWAQISYYMFGNCWSFLDKSFPFSSETERETLWKTHKKEVIDCIYRDKSEFPNEWRCPDASQLRPKEWFLRDAPEPRLALNDARTLFETDVEFLTQTGLLSDKDRERIASQSFQEAEEKALDYIGLSGKIVEGILESIEEPEWRDAYEKKRGRILDTYRRLKPAMTK